MKNPRDPGGKTELPELRLTRSVGLATDSRDAPKASARNAATPSPSPRSCKPGDLVANQYEVAGCLAHGGLGWIYLAKDHNVSDRWVVLKGLLNTGDKDALAVAIVEKQFLAQVEHPLIVEIYNFVTHDDAGYIVMEYVGGTSLKQILKDRMRANNGKFDPLPVDQALAYILEILPAFSYLHDLGLIYCDFKPDNLIQVGDAVKLIDLGGVRRADDQESAIYGTVGYQAPEVAQVGPSVASDIYTIGRTLVVLMMEFRGYQSTYVASLPPVAETPLFADHDSLYRLLAKACAADPADRFASVDEFRVQLLGVLREVVAQKTSGTALTSAASVLFEAPAITSEALEWDELPALRVDTSDPQYAWLSNISRRRPRRAHWRSCAERRRQRQRFGWPRRVPLCSCGAGTWSIRSSTRCSSRTRGSGGRSGSAVSRHWTLEISRQRSPPSMRSMARCRASSLPSWPWRWRASAAEKETSPRACIGPAPAPTPTTWLPRRSAWHESAPPGATSPARSRRWTWCHRPAAATPRRAGCARSSCTSRVRDCPHWPRRWTVSTESSSIRASGAS